MIYLASKSPRRSELLRQLGVAFDELHLREAPGRNRDIVEEAEDDEPPAHYVERIARTKAAVAWARMQQRKLALHPVLGADTEVVIGTEVLGKPRDASHAADMLARLSGRTHDVMTGVALKTSDDDIAFTMSTSRVSFRDLSSDEIARYAALPEALGKAGGYAIQGRAAAFVAHLDGSYSGVMGLPLFETAELLARTGLVVL
ncbi:MAG TPA: Maf family protein [Casimicrobiaceae bacterium]|nr:Maf family protein [Casimicrobiaceae bacterium]